MAFDALRPHQSQILGLIDQGRTLAQIVDILSAQHGVLTTPGTLSRFAASSRPPASKPRAVVLPQRVAVAPPELSAVQHAQVDAVALTTELLAEIHASRHENRDILEHLAGKVAGLSADVTELESAIDRNGQTLRDQVTAALAAAPAKAVSAGPHIVAMKAPKVPARVILKVWLRALVVTALLWAALLAFALARWPTFLASG